MTKSHKNVGKQLFFPAELNAEHVFAWQCSLLWCGDNQKQESARGEVEIGGVRLWGGVGFFFFLSGGWSLHVRLFLMPGVLVRAGVSFAALQAQRSSLALAFHTRSTVKACDRLQTPQPSPRAQPSPLLFGQLWIFQRHESNPVRHATVQPHSVSAAVWRRWRRRPPLGRGPCPAAPTVFDVKNWL